MPAEKDQLLAGFNGNPSTSAAAVRQFEVESGFHLPKSYVEFLEQSDGGEGFVGPNAYVVFWRLEELFEMNEAYQTNEFAPGLFLFGSDGGGEAFAFDRRFDPNPIVSVPFVGMGLKLARLIAPDFRTFLEELAKS